MKYIKTYENQESENNQSLFDISQTIESHTTRNALGRKEINVALLNINLYKLFHNKYCEFYDTDDNKIQVCVDDVRILVEAIVGGCISRVSVYFATKGRFYKVNHERLVKVYENGFTDTKEAEVKIRWYKKGKLESDK
jgi:hypothetical protein